MRFVRVAAVNVAVLLLLLLTIELGGRVFSFGRSCFAGSCTAARLFALDLTASSTRLSVPHSKLGYVPRETYDGVMWRDKQVTIRNGFRANGPRSRADESTEPRAHALAVGDSFTFGDEVSDGETWLSCVERAIGRPVHNGGVFGYGGAQSVLRAELELEERAYAAVIWSILVGDDFWRDTQGIRFGARVPRVVATGDMLAFDYPLSPSALHRVDWFLLRHSKLWLVSNRLWSDYVADHRIRSENAPSIERIIRFAVDRFAKLPVRQKVIVLQYNRDLASDARRRDERDEIMQAARMHGIPVIDLAGYLSRFDPSELWLAAPGHYTELGHQMVCEAILATGDLL